MAFNIANWKSNTESNKGFMRSHSYEVIVSPPGSISDEISIHTESVSLPGISFMSIDNHRPFGYGETYSIPYVYNPTEISCLHQIDGKGDIYKTLIDWSNLVVDTKGDFQYAARYFNEYTTDMTINVYDLDSTLIRKITLYNVFPSSIDQLQMNWGSNDEIAKLSVTYRYTNFVVE